MASLPNNVDVATTIIIIIIPLIPNFSGKELAERWEFAVSTPVP